MSNQRKTPALRSDHEGREDGGGSELFRGKGLGKPTVRSTRHKIKVKHNMTKVNSKINDNYLIT